MQRVAPRIGVFVCDCDEQEFGAVFLATGADPIDLSRCPQYGSSHPNVVTGIEFERLLEQGLKRLSDGEEPERVVFVQCAGSRSGPDKKAKGVSYCSRTCCSVTAKQVDRLLLSQLPTKTSESWARANATLIVIRVFLRRTALP